MSFSSTFYAKLLRKAFTLIDPKIVKIWQLDFLFYAFGIWAQNAASETFMKLSPDLGQVKPVFVSLIQGAHLNIP